MPPELCGDRRTERVDGMHPSHRRPAQRCKLNRKRKRQESTTVRSTPNISEVVHGYRPSSPTGEAKEYLVLPITSRISQDQDAALPAAGEETPPRSSKILRSPAMCGAGAVEHQDDMSSQRRRWSSRNKAKGYVLVGLLSRHAGELAAIKS